MGRGLQVKVLILGEGPDRQRLEDMVRKEKIEKQVQLVGFQDDVTSWLSVMDMFVLPSLMEGSPMALLEAMAHGLPVVASRVGGIPAIIRSGQSGILTQAGNARDIAQAIVDLYDNKHLRDTVGREARRTIQEKYNLSDWARKIEAEYINLLA